MIDEGKVGSRGELAQRFGGLPSPSQPDARIIKGIPFGGWWSKVQLTLRRNGSDVLTFVEPPRADPHAGWCGSPRS